jgi:hypothetical protein
MYQRILFAFVMTNVVAVAIAIGTAFAVDQVSDAPTTAQIDQSTKEAKGSTSEKPQSASSTATPAGQSAKAKPSAGIPKVRKAGSYARLPTKGMVWVNTDTDVFHREGDEWYGKTKHGKYMTEADASKAGYRDANDDLYGKR